MPSTVRHKEFGKDFGLMHEVVVTGRKAGADKEFWSALAHNEDLFGFIVRSVKTLDSEDNMDLEMFKFKRASKILGDDFISPQDVTSARGLTYSDEQLQQLAATLPSDLRVLKQLRSDGYLLVAGPPNEMDVLNIYELNPQLFQSGSDDWRAVEAEKLEKITYRDTVATNWLGLRKGFVPNSTNKTWWKQQLLLTSDERVPNVAEVVWGFTTYAEVRSNPLVFSRMYVRTSSVSAYDIHLSVGGYDGLNIGNCSDGLLYDQIGLASAWKL